MLAFFKYNIESLNLISRALSNFVDIHSNGTGIRWELSNSFYKLRC